MNEHSAYWGVGVAVWFLLALFGLPVLAGLYLRDGGSETLAVTALVLFAVVPPCAMIACFGNRDALRNRASKIRAFTFWEVVWLMLAIGSLAAGLAVALVFCVVMGSLFGSMLIACTRSGAGDEP